MDTFPNSCQPLFWLSVVSALNLIILAVFWYRISAGIIKINDLIEKNRIEIHDLIFQMKCLTKKNDEFSSEIPKQIQNLYSVIERSCQVKLDKHKLKEVFSKIQSQIGDLRLEIEKITGGVL